MNLFELILVLVGVWALTSILGLILWAWATGYLRGPR